MSDKNKNKRSEIRRLLGTKNAKHKFHIKGVFVTYLDDLFRINVNWSGSWRFYLDAGLKYDGCTPQSVVGSREDGKGAGKQHTSGICHVCSDGRMYQSEDPLYKWMCTTVNMLHKTEPFSNVVQLVLPPHQKSACLTMEFYMEEPILKDCFRSGVKWFWRTGTFESPIYYCKNILTGDIFQHRKPFPQ